MWRHYFGVNCYVHGVDLEEACKVYENTHTRIDVGDQADRMFWKRFKEMKPVIDIVVDDGGHFPEQQIITLEEMLPHLRPGGVYLCEDVHGEWNLFSSYVHGLAVGLNACVWTGTSEADSGETGCVATGFQAKVCSVHLYPFATVIERTDVSIFEFVDRKYGTEWQPFLH